MKKIPIAVQAYSVRHDIQKDLPGTLKKLKEIGYDGVEFFGDYKDHDPAVLKDALDQAGLKLVGWHTMLSAFENMDELIAFHKAVGNNSVVVPWLDVPLNEDKSFDDQSYAAWKEYAVTLSKAARTLAEHDMYTGYHNHDFEFKFSKDDQNLFDAFFETADEAVIVQLDTGNAAHGGANPMEYLKKYKNRIRTVHLKPYSTTEGYDTMVGGEGDVHDWKEVIDICNEGSTEWFIVEYESEKLYEPMEGVKLCLDGIKEFM